MGCFNFLPWTGHRELGYVSNSLSPPHFPGGQRKILEARVQRTSYLCSLNSAAVKIELCSAPYGQQITRLVIGHDGAIPSLVGVPDKFRNELELT